MAHLPPRVRLMLRGALADARGLPRRFTDPQRRRDPWQTLHNDGSNADFHTSGAMVLKELIDIGGMKATDRVLDIGCGNGRIARPAATFLSSGRYTGFDIAAGAIRACRTQHAGDGRFAFHHLDVRNTEYNPGGRLSDAELTFPCEDGQIDFLFAISVFTHLTPEASDRYLAECARSLAPGGRAFITILLLNEPRRAGIADGQSRFALHPWRDAAMVADPASPEQCIAHDESVVRERLTSLGLKVDGLIRGQWCPPTTSEGHMHDVLLLSRS